MKTILIPLMLIYTIQTYCQNSNMASLIDGKAFYFKLKQDEKKKFFSELSDKYESSNSQDTIQRQKIINFLLDSVIPKDKDYSFIASEILLKDVRLNEITRTQKQSLVAILNKKIFNVCLFEFIGLLGDNSLEHILYQLFEDKALKFSNVEKMVLTNSLFSLGNEEAINSKLQYLNTMCNNKDKVLSFYFAQELKISSNINSRLIYDFMFEIIEKGNQKKIVVGDFGGDEFGGDGKEYCTLSCYAIELLSKVIVDFPLTKVYCNYNIGKDEIRIIQKWYKNNPDFKFKKWHPYYGTEYKYWP